MEKRALIAIALSVAVLLGWQFWLAPTPRRRRSARALQTPPASGATVPAPGADVGTARPTVVPRATQAAAAVAEVVSPLYRVSFAADGSVTAWTIEYRGAKRLVVESSLRPLAVAVQRAGPGRWSSWRCARMPRGWRSARPARRAADLHGEPRRTAFASGGRSSSGPTPTGWARRSRSRRRPGARARSTCSCTGPRRSPSPGPTPDRPVAHVRGGEGRPASPGADPGRPARRRSRGPRGPCPGPEGRQGIAGRARAEGSACWCRMPSSLASTGGRRSRTTTSSRPSSAARGPP